jgi:anti-sigma B factor antagonist
MEEDFKVTVDIDSFVTPVIYISGEVTSEADDAILNIYESIPTAKKPRVIIDFSKTAYINSAGIATLISLITRASENHCKIEFSGLNSHFKKVMDIVGLTDFVIIYDTLEQALNA